MGQFSWLCCDTGEQVLDDVYKDSYLLIPKEFGGGYIKEECYDGYGHFGGKDIFDLVAEWNKNFIPDMLDYRKEGNWVCTSNLIKDEEAMKYYLGEAFEGELRDIGIEMACYDSDNERLPYPIKIASRPMLYEEAAPSLSDPNQGWRTEEEEDYRIDFYNMTDSEFDELMEFLNEHRFNYEVY